MADNRTSWWRQARFLLAFVLWFLTFDRLWDVGKLITSGQPLDVAPVGNALLLFLLALLASWRLPAHRSR